MADHSATLNLVLPPIEFEGTADYHGPRSTDTSNAFDGAENGGGAIVIKTPPVVLPAGPVPVIVEKAIAFPMPTLNDKGQPVSDSFIHPHVVERPGYVERVVFAGRDITWIFADPETGTDLPTRVPGYTTIEPFGYGASEELVIPRTNSLFEKYGTGRLVWLDQWATVQYQRVYNIGTEDEEVIVDYRGVALAVRPSGKEFRVDVGGEVSARAMLAYKPPVKARKSYDIGSMIGYAAENFGIRLFPPGGPDTGLIYPNEGGLTWAGWIAKLGALSRTARSQARALMPTVWGGPRYGFNAKDTETVHATIFPDGDRVDISGLVDDVNEQPNGVYGNGISPDGEHWDGGRYPGVVQGKPAPYPFDDDGPFGEGTTDAETNTGSGITIMRKKLVHSGYLDPHRSSGSTYDAHVADAVDLLKAAAHLTQDGIMTLAAWNALWDLNVTGRNLEGARIFPLARDPEVGSWIYSANGDIIGRNPDHKVGKGRVDVAYDYGVCEEDAATQHAWAVINTAAGHQWAGSVVLKDIQVFAGDVDTDDVSGLTAADLMSARDLRPGMNVRIAHFDGAAGVVLHIAQASWSPGEDTDGDTVSLMLDTGARDVFDLTQALKRNQDSRRSYWRDFNINNRGIRPPGNFVARDRYFGKVYQDVDLAGGRWNQVPVILGQMGNVGRTDILLQGFATEHCGALFARPVVASRLQRLVGNPFQVDSNGQTAWEHESLRFLFDDKVLLYLYGQGKQPGGYGWKPGYDADGNRITANPLTGRHLDGASFPYATPPQTAPLAYFLVYPRRSCKLRRGQLFAALEDDVT